MIQKAIVFFGQSAIAQCDTNCDKAWGINTRPKVQLSADPDDYAFLADDELGIAPIDPGTYEGVDAKPRTRPMTGDLMNRWCVRECERNTFTPKPLPDFSQRIYNIRREGSDRPTADDVFGVLPPSDPKAASHPGARTAAK